MKRVEPYIVLSSIYSRQICKNHNDISILIVLPTIEFAVHVAKSTYANWKMKIDRIHPIAIFKILVRAGGLGITSDDFNRAKIACPPITTPIDRDLSQVLKFDKSGARSRNSYCRQSRLLGHDGLQRFHAQLNQMNGKYIELILKCMEVIKEIATILETLNLLSKFFHR